MNKIPFVSVIMPVRNEADFIGRSLGAVLAQNYPRDAFEVIVADGRSTDETRVLIDEMRLGTDVPVTLVDNPKQIAPTGLNRALGSARGEIVVRVDGHCEIAPDYVTNCVRYLVEERADGVGGPIETIGADRKSRAIAVAMSSPFGVGGSAFRTINDREMYVDTVAFPGYTRSMLERAGAFDEELVRNQDDEFNYRVRKLGGRILLAPDIRSRYHSRGTFRKLWRQYFQYGFWKVRVLQLHPRQMSPRQFVPFAFVATLMTLSVISLFFWPAALALAGVAGLYLVAALAATLRAGAVMEFKTLPMIFAGFVILHLSYGLGFMWGLVRFAGRWR